MDAWNPENTSVFVVPDFLPSTVLGELPAPSLPVGFSAFLPPPLSTLHLSPVCPLSFWGVYLLSALISSSPSCLLLSSYSLILFSCLLVYFVFFLSLFLTYLIYLSISVTTSWCDSVFHFLRRSFYFVLPLGKSLLLPPLNSDLESWMENNLRFLYFTIWLWEQTAFILRAATCYMTFWTVTIRGYLRFELKYKPAVVYLSRYKPRGMISSKINPNLAGRSSAHSSKLYSFTKTLIWNPFSSYKCSARSYFSLKRCI